MKPADKLAWIRAAQQGAKGKKRIVAMVGDGINDGPSLMAADVGTSLALDKRGKRGFDYTGAREPTL